MGMKVCKLVRLTQKNDKGEFVKGKDASHVEVRSRVVIPEETVAEYEESSAARGLLYVVDEKATAERDEIVANENKTPAEEVEEVEDFKDDKSKKAEDFKDDKSKGAAGGNKL